MNRTGNNSFAKHEHAKKALQMHYDWENIKTATDEWSYE